MGPGWNHNDNWLSANPVSTWYGVTVFGGRVLELDLYKNKLIGSIPPEIGDLINLTSLYLGYNQLSGSIPPQIGNLTNLDNLLLYDNLLTDLPDLSHLASLGILYIQDNRFTFEDIEPNITIPDFDYSPQAKIGETEDITKAEGSSVTFSVKVGGTANQYQWYKDGVIISGATNSDYTIDPLDFGDAGSYTCEISNTIATELTLKSHPKNLTVVDAPTSITVTSPNGGETWYVRTAYNISWVSDNYTGEVKIEISTTGGATWWDITEGKNTKNDGEYSYTPNENNISNHCLFRVTSVVNPNISDQSDGEFVITDFSPPSDWEKQVSGTANRLLDVKAVSELVAWTVGDNGTVLRTIDGGENWENVWPLSDMPSTYNIEALNNNVAFVHVVTGDWSQGTNIAFLYKTTNGGDSWTEVYQQDFGWINDISMFNQANGIAIGDSVDGVWTIIKTTNGGDSWQPIANALSAAMEGEYGFRTAICWVDNKTGWFGTNSSRAFYTTDGGENWIEKIISQLEMVYAIDFNKDGFGVAAHSTGPIIKTTDNGAHWPGDFSSGRWCNPSS